MKWIFLLLILAPLGYSQTTRSSESDVAGERRNYNSQAYYTQPANAQYLYPQNPLGYYANNAYANYPEYQQKQDFSNTLTDLFNSGDGNNGGEDALGAIGAAVTAIGAAVGLKLLKKLGAAIVFTFVFVIIPLFIVPIVLAIAAIIVSTVNNANGQANDIAQKIRDKLNGNKRSLSLLENYLLKEQCIERISCAVGRRAYNRSFIFNQTWGKARQKSSRSRRNATPETPHPEEHNKNSTFISRVSRAFRSADCEVYRCSLASYFS